MLFLNKSLNLFIKIKRKCPHNQTFQLVHQLLDLLHLLHPKLFGEGEWQLFTGQVLVAGGGNAGPKRRATRALSAARASVQESEAVTLAAEAAPAPLTITTGRLDVNGPLPADFRALFAQACSKATGAAPADFKVLEENVVKSTGNVIVEVVFQAPAHLVQVVRARREPLAEHCPAHVDYRLHARRGGADATCLSHYRTERCSGRGAHVRRAATDA